VSGRVDRALAAAMQNALAGDFSSGRATSSLLSNEGVYALGRLLMIQHLTAATVNKEAFERVLAEAARLSGAMVEWPPSATSEGFDLIIDELRLSLKSEASRRISREFMTISKLMESAWARELRTAADAHALVPRIVDKLSLHDVMLVLRAFRHDACVRYELVQVPKGILATVASLQPGDFAVPTTRGHTSADVSVDGEFGFVLVFDGSDQKITIRRLQTRLTLLHAWWEIPRIIGVSSDGAPAGRESKSAASIRDAS
jgi:hypothetical protein